MFFKTQLLYNVIVWVTEVPGSTIRYMMLCVRKENVYILLEDQALCLICTREDIY